MLPVDGPLSSVHASLRSRRGRRRRGTCHVRRVRPSGRRRAPGAAHHGALVGQLRSRATRRRLAGHERRLDDPADFVRIEIESALERSIPVIPILVREATMPRPDDLPESLRELVFRSGLQIRPDPDFHRDMDRLINALSGLL